jgi:hypothetical protein
MLAWGERLCLPQRDVIALVIRLSFFTARPPGAIVGGSPDQPRKDRWFVIPHPDEDDVVVRRKDGDPGVVFVLGTPPAPDQFTLRTRDEAVAQALSFAKRQHVCAWFTNGGDEFVLLGTFRKETMKSAR